VNPGQIGYEGVGWIELTRDSVQLRISVDIDINDEVHWKFGYFDWPSNCQLFV